MFRAIDIDGDNGLSYGEVVSVMEPPTLTSVSMNGLSRRPLWFEHHTSATSTWIARPCRTELLSVSMSCGRTGCHCTAPSSLASAVTGDRGRKRGVASTGSRSAVDVLAGAC